VKTTIKLMAFMVATSGLSSAASMLVSNLVDVNFSAPVLGVGSVPMDSSHKAMIGYMDPAVVLATTDTYTTISSNWLAAGEIVFASGDAAGYDGYFSGQVVFNDAKGLAGKDLTIWITDGALVNFVLSTNTGIKFLADAAIPNENAALIEKANLATWTTRLGTYDAAANGGMGSFVANDAIPETSTAILGALGALGLLRRRRI
jgi:hypothetical protein